MDYNKVREKYGFKNFSKTKFYKVFVKDGVKKLLTFKKVYVSSRNSESNLYEFYVVNFDQIESEKDIRTNDYISKLKKGAIVKKVDIRLDRDYEKFFDNLKKINFDIGDKDFNYSRSVTDVSKGLRDLIPKNFISYDLNPDEKEEE